MKQNFEELLNQYPRLQLATEADNEEILDFLDQISMKTERGAITANRRPHFFDLCHIQGDKFFTVLMRNDDDTIGGMGVLSLFPMNVHGTRQVIGYASDLRLSPQMSRKTRVQFHKWYADLAHYCSDIEEFEGSPYILTSIFDENTAAKKALVGGSSQKSREPHYHPVFSYQNVNVMGRFPWAKKSPLKCELAQSLSGDQILSLLTSNPNDAEFVWTEEEVLRKLQRLGKSLNDFLVITDKQKNILACALPLSDEAYRKMVVKNLQLPTKIFGKALPLFGRPSIKDGVPLNTGYLGFLKVSSKLDKRDALLCFLNHVFRVQNGLSVNDRFHSLTFFDNQKEQTEKFLRRAGYICLTLPATIYQVVHKSSSSPKDWLEFSETKNPDFEVSCL